MKFEVFRDLAFEIALTHGCTAAETYYAAGEDFSVNVLEGELDRYKVSRSSGLGLRVQFEGKNGYAYTEVLEAPEELVLSAIDNARVIENDDEHPMQGKCEYREVTLPKNPLSPLSEEERIELAFEMERAAKAADPRVKRMGYCTVASQKGIVRIDNTLGLSACEEMDYGYCLAGPILAEGEESKNAFKVKEGIRADQVTACAVEAVEEAIAQFGASPVPAGEYRVLFRADAAVDLLQAFSCMFSADRAQKGLSLLAGKEGERIAADCVSIVDDPFEKEMPSAFDGEGTPTIKKTVVEKGVLTTLLHNLKTAKKAGVSSTGNASRPSPASPVGVAPSNFYILPGEKSRDAMIETLDNGLIITEVSGLHAGVTPVSGQFSLLANGMLIENGKPVHPV
ncbi:MAG: TldD/PmbA family protein, partial [Clostridia bacterium]|nr:TldD/PmbA family protein [Clostridia bacterium]